MKIKNNPKTWTKSESTIFVATVLVPMVFAILFIVYGEDSLSLTNWEYWMKARLFFSGLLVAGNLFFLKTLISHNKTIKHTQISRLKLYITPFMLMLILLFILRPRIAYGDLVNKPMTYQGACNIESKVTQVYFDHLQHFIILNDLGGTPKLRIGRQDYSYLKGENSSYGWPDNFIGYDGPCDKPANILYLPYSKRAFIVR